MNSIQNKSQSTTTTLNSAQQGGEKGEKDVNDEEREKQ